jgi:hypothetical protein
MAPPRDPTQQCAVAQPFQHLIASVKHYRSLMPMAQEAGKPMFHLTSADGAIGAHTKAVAEARQNFSKLAAELLARCGIGEPLSIS